MNDQVTRAPRRRRRNHTPEFKQALVARSLQQDSSVASIALEAGVNANLLFMWRRSHFDAVRATAAPAAPSSVLVPVEIEAPSDEPAAVAASSPASRAPGTIEIELAGARVRLRGAVDEASVRCVLQTLYALA